MRASSPEAVRPSFRAVPDPDRPPLWATPHADAADRAACRNAIRAGSRSFFAASALLPAQVRRPAYGLYAFCRLSDDAIDEVDGRDRPAALARLATRLARIYEDAPCDAPADRAMADLVTAHQLPHALPAALIEGLAWDANGRRYETLSDLTAYAARVAGSVGAELIPSLRPGPNDVVFVKKKPSGFHGTPLLGYLVERGIDTVVIVGGATSNCIRATVFDAASFNLRAIVPAEAVFDRIPVSHAISLFDMDRQFADVVPVEAVLQHLRQPA